MSVAVAAKRAGKSPETVRRAIRSGALEARRFGARGWYSVSAADLESFIWKSHADRADAAEGAAGTEDEIRKAS